MPQDCFKSLRSCPFLSATARRKKSKKSLSSDWAYLLRPGLMTEVACSRLSVVGEGEKGRAREQNEGGLRRGREGESL